MHDKEINEIDDSVVTETEVEDPQSDIESFAYELPIEQIAKIKRDFEEIDGNTRRSLPAGLRIGRNLIQIKPLVPHGEWKSLIEKNCPFDIRAAQLFMDLFRERRYLKGVTDSLLSITDALRIIREKRREENEAKLTDIEKLQRKSDERKRAVGKILKKVEGYCTNLEKVINEAKDAERPDAVEALDEVLDALKQGIENLKKLPQEMREPARQES